jgi:hypothetical protein
MAKQIKFLRGTTAQNDVYVGPPGTFTIDLDRMEIRLHDGETAGGFIIPNYTTIQAIFSETTSIAIDGGTTSQTQTVTYSGAGAEPVPAGSAMIYDGGGA